MKEIPTADCEERSLRSWGILTTDETSRIPVPRALDTANLRHGVSVSDRSMRRVL